MKDKETGSFKKKAVKIVSVWEEAGEASLGKKENTVEQPRWKCWVPFRRYFISQRIVQISDLYKHQNIG